MQNKKITFDNLAKEIKKMTFGLVSLDGCDHRIDGVSLDSCHEDFFTLNLEIIVFKKGK